MNGCCTAVTSSHHLIWYEPPQLNTMSTRDRRKMSTTVSHSVLYCIVTNLLSKTYEGNTLPHATSIICGLTHCLPCLFDNHRHSGLTVLFVHCRS
jgi:hypothetical protein